MYGRYNSDGISYLRSLYEVTLYGWVCCLKPIKTPNITYYRHLFARALLGSDEPELGAIFVPDCCCYNVHVVHCGLHPFALFSIHVLLVSCCSRVSSVFCTAVCPREADIGTSVSYWAFPEPCTVLMLSDNVPLHWNLMRVWCLPVGILCDGMIE